MDILEPWLAATIEGKLSEALRHWEEGTNKHHSAGKSRGLSYDDGSNLRIPSAKKGPVVQITKFLTFKDPIQVTLSDSVIRINASITNQASQRYAEKNRRKLTDGTVGGLIQLHEFEIVATHLGPRDKRLTLYVKDFKSLGADGSGNFGVAPQAIESREGTKKLLDKLADLRRHGLDPPSEQSPAASPIRSQPSTQTSEAGNNQDSQVGFATQVPPSIAPVIPRSKALRSTTSINVASTLFADNAKSSAHPAKLKHGNPLASTLNPPQVQAAPQRPSVSHRKALLGLLRNHNRFSLAPGLIPEPALEQSPGQLTASSQPLAGEKENEASQIINLAPRDSVAGRASIWTQKRKRQSPETTPRKKTSNDVDLQGIDNGRESLAVNHELENKASSGVAATEISLDLLRSQPSNPSISKSAKFHRNARPEPVHPMTKTTSPVSIRNRISSRDVSIPKDQVALLSRADSWLPAEPGQREPSANVPISLLRTLNLKAELRDQGPTKLPKQGNRTVAPSAVNDVTADSESDAPVSSGQWPASPEREQLPPDSSPASAKQSQSGNVPPTTPGASTSMFLDLTSWNERDEGSGRKDHYPKANNESDSVEVSALMPLLLDGRLNSPRNEEVSRRHSSTGSESASKMPPDVPLPQTQSATTSQDGNNIARQTRSSPIPASPTPESDLEFTVPLALNEKTDTIASSEPMQRFPCTASQPQDPFTQVKQTPYVNSHVQAKSLSQSRLSSPLIDLNLNPLANGNINDDTEYVTASITSGPATSTAEPNRESGRSHTIEDQGVGKVTARLAEEINNQGGADSDAEEPDKVITEDQQERNKSEIVADKPVNSSLVITQSQCQSLGLNQPAMVEEANLKSPAVSEKLSTAEDGHGDRSPQLSTPDHATNIAREAKRKVADSSFVSPSVTKRQKRFKIPSAFTLTERSDVPRDPSDGARQYRQDFLASRRSSESSTPTMSPTMPFTVFPWTTPESPRDPSERARQIRQELLASRRSSEISTPTSSPRMQFNALMGTIQAERCNVEVAKNLDQASLHKHSADPEIEGQKITESEELSARSKIRDLELNAAAFPNGSASVEPNGEDAKPGAQDNPPSDYNADSPTFVVQNADVKCPDVEQSTVLEPSSCASNDEKQRARSLELSVSMQSPDHRESEDGLASAKGEADQTVNLEIDLTAASHDHLANRNGQSRAVEPESDKARNSSPSRADQVAEQESNVTLGAIFDHVAEHENAAPASIHHHCSTEENPDTQMPDLTASESTPHQESVAVDANNSMPDKIAMEPTSGQHLNGVGTITPMAGVQAFPDTTSLISMALSREPIDQTSPLHSVGPAFVAESNTEILPSLSPTTPILVKPLSNPMSDSELKPLEKHQSPVRLPIEITEPDPPTESKSIFDNFKATYPAYPGDLKHFTAMCRKISQLVKANKMEHQSLWDDFIVRHKIEYSQYLRRCAEEAEDAVSYEVFYQTEIEGPQYHNHVISRRNLDEALALLAQQPNLEQMQAEPIRDDMSPAKPVNHKLAFKSSPVIKNIPHQYAPANNDESLKPGETKFTSPHKPAVSCKFGEKPSEPPVLIDLTEDDLPDNPPKRTKEGKIASQPEARNRIKGAIDTRVRNNARRGAGHASQDRKVLKFDREVVKGVVETSRMSSTGPLPTPHTNPAVEGEKEGTPWKWWDDENSPFRSFARAYASIRHGNGNSFAKAGAAEPGDSQKAGETTKSGVELKRINIMRWDL